MNNSKVLLGFAIFLIGVGLLVFDKTKSIAPFPIGFGLGLLGAGVSEK